MASSYNMYTPRSKKNEEFHEDDIWRIHREIRQPNPNSLDSYEESNSKNVNPTASKNIPKSSSRNEPKKKITTHQSAPVSIPDWSKIYGASYSKKPSHRNSSFVDHGISEDDAVINNSNSVWDSDDDEDDEDDDEGKIVPPHEWIARRLARAQISSFSVCEGIGRTLKGRDLSNVRNAVLTRTGFLE